MTTGDLRQKGYAIEVLLERGLERYRTGATTTALQLWDEALAIDPDEPRALTYIDYVRQNWDEVDGCVDPPVPDVSDLVPNYAVERPPPPVGNVQAPVAGQVDSQELEARRAEVAQLDARIAAARAEAARLEGVPDPVHDAATPRGTVDYKLGGVGGDGWGLAPETLVRTASVPGVSRPWQVATPIAAAAVTADLGPGAGVAAAAPASSPFGLDDALTDPRMRVPTDDELDAMSEEATGMYPRALAAAALAGGGEQVATARTVTPVMLARTATPLLHGRSSIGAPEPLTPLDDADFDRDLEEALGAAAAEADEPAAPAALGPDLGAIVPVSGLDVLDAVPIAVGDEDFDEDLDLDLPPPVADAPPGALLAGAVAEVPDASPGEVSDAAPEAPVDPAIVAPDELLADSAGAAPPVAPPADDPFGDDKPTVWSPMPLAPMMSLAERVEQALARDPDPFADDGVTTAWQAPPSTLVEATRRPDHPALPLPVWARSGTAALSDPASELAAELMSDGLPVFDRVTTPLRIQRDEPGADDELAPASTTSSAPAGAGAPDLDPTDDIELAPRSGVVPGAGSQVPGGGEPPLSTEDVGPLERASGRPPPAPRPGLDRSRPLIAADERSVEDSDILAADGDDEVAMRSRTQTPRLAQPRRGRTEPPAVARTLTPTGQPAVARTLTPTGQPAVARTLTPTGQPAVARTLTPTGQAVARTLTPTGQPAVARTLTPTGEAGPATSRVPTLPLPLLAPSAEDEEALAAARASTRDLGPRAGAAAAAAAAGAGDAADEPRGDLALAPADARLVASPDAGPPALPSSEIRLTALSPAERADRVSFDGPEAQTVTIMPESIDLAAPAAAEAVDVAALAELGDGEDPFELPTAPITPLPEPVAIAVPPLPPWPVAPTMSIDASLDPESDALFEASIDASIAEFDAAATSARSVPQDEQAAQGPRAKTLELVPPNAGPLWAPPPTGESPDQVDTADLTPRIPAPPNEFAAPVAVAQPADGRSREVDTVDLGVPVPGWSGEPGAAPFGRRLEAAPAWQPPPLEPTPAWQPPPPVAPDPDTLDRLRRGDDVFAPDGSERLGGRLSPAVLRGLGLTPMVDGATTDEPTRNGWPTGRRPATPATTPPASEPRAPDHGDGGPFAEGGGPLAHGELAPPASQLDHLALEDLELPAPRTASATRTPGEVLLRSSAPEALSAALASELDRGAPTGESPDDRARRRITALLERASAAARAGEHPMAIAAIDLALSEAPDSAVAQKLVHRSRDIILDCYQRYFGDLTRRPVPVGSLTDLTGRALDPRAAFLVSRMDGNLTYEEILDVAGMGRLEACRHLAQLLVRGIIRAA